MNPDILNMLMRGFLCCVWFYGLYSAALWLSARLSKLAEYIRENERLMMLMGVGHE